MAVDYAAPILVIDDEQVMIDLTRRVLGSIGFEQVDHALDGENALSLLRQRKYQLVISDLRMKLVSGLQILRTVRQDPDLRNTPFLLMTASLESDAVKAAKLAGADAYLLKPFTPRQLRAKLNEIFAVSQF
jgi:two-component system, chemotaxis family, chemotaxis protein CheY